MRHLELKSSTSATTEMIWKGINLTLNIMQFSEDRISASQETVRLPAIVTYK